MRTFLAVLILQMVGCGHSDSRGRVPGEVGGTPSTVTTQQGREAVPSEPLPNLSALRLALSQVPSTTDVTFELKLTNTGPAPIKITTNPRFGHRVFDGRREDEFEIQLLDARGHWIPFQCSDRRLQPYQPKVAPLQPGQTLTFTLSLGGGCYDLASGERLSFIATYANLFTDEPLPTKNLPNVQPSDWLDVVVPAGWSNGGAARPGVAAGGAARRRSPPPSAGPEPSWYFPRWTLLEIQNPGLLAGSGGLWLFLPGGTHNRVGLASDLGFSLGGVTVALGPGILRVMPDDKAAWSVTVQGLIHRTWPWWTPRLPTSTTYVGTEVSAVYVMYRCWLGAMRAMSDRENPEWKLIGGIGIGLP